MTKIFKPSLPTVGGMYKKKHTKKPTKKTSKKNMTVKKQAPFMWRMVIINGMVKKMKVNKKKRGGYCPLPMSNDPNQYLLLQPEVKNVQGQPSSVKGGKKNKRGGYCGCQSGQNGSSNNLATQASMGGMKKKKMSMSEYKENLQKKNLEKLKKIARNKGLKIVKKDGTVLKKSSIIKKLCDCRSKK